jgi:hypothetical protein
MKRLNYLLAGSILVALVLALVAFFPASADKPPVERSHFEEDFVVDLCGVEIPGHYDGVLKYTGLCDDKRHSCGEVALWKENWTLNYNGREVNVHGSTRYRTTWLNWYDALYETNGSSYHGTIPGYGVVSGWSGKQVIYETCEGDWPDTWECEYEVLHEPGMEFYDFEAICDYFLNGD